jgi:hypothetical protein
MSRLLLLGVGVLFLFAAVWCWVRTSRDYRLARSLLFLALGIPFVVAGVFYTASSYSGEESVLPSPSTPAPVVITATPLPATPPPAPSQPVVSANRLPYDAAVRAAQKVAVERYPELGVANSPFNRTFVSAYRRLREQNPEYFTDSNWPVALAEEVDRELRSPQ